MASFFLQFIMVISFAIGCAQIVFLPFFENYLLHPFQIKEAKYLKNGTIKLLANHLDGFNENQRSDELDKISNQYGYVIELKNLDALQLEAIEKQQLLEGHVIINDSLDSLFLLSGNQQVLLIGHRAKLPEHIPTKGSRFAMGDFHLIQHNLKKRAKEFWPSYIQNVNKLYPFSVGLLDISRTDLTTNQIQALLDGKIVAVENEVSDQYDLPAQWIYQSVDDGQQVLFIGPLTDKAESFIFQFFLLYYFMIALMVLLPVTLWLAPTWVSFRRLSVATKTVSSGNLKVSIKPFFGSNFKPIFHTFNLMIHQIDELFKSHKLLTSAVSHDLKMPLAKLEFALELLKTSESDDEQSQQIARMEKTVDEMNMLVKEFLTYTNIDMEEPHLTYSTVQLHAWIEGQIVLMQKISGKIKISNSVPPSTEVIMDKYFMLRALENLINNSVRYAKKQICIKFYEDDKCWCLSVEDDGPGVSDMDKERIFLPFERVEDSRNRKLAGTGLGLAIVKKISRLHQGNAWAEDSEIGGIKLIMSISKTLTKGDQ